MELTDRLQFDDKDRKDLYDYIERHGRVRETDARRSLNLDEQAFGAHLTVLRRNGYVQKVDDELQVAYHEDVAEVHELDDLVVTVRTANQQDHDALEAAVDAVASEGSYIEAETVAAILDYEEAIIRHNDVMSRLFFVAEVATEAGEEEVVGWVHLDLPEAEKLSHTAILTVGLVPAYRGHGIGEALLERGTRWAREHGYEKLYNSVPSTNKGAIKFLERHGWKTEAVRKDHYKMEGEYVDEVMMGLDPRTTE